MKKQFLMAVLAMALFSSHVMIGMEMENKDYNKRRHDNALLQQIDSINALNQQLFEAVKKESPSRIKELVDAGANVNATDKEGRTPLHKAAYLGNRQDHMIVLINAKADVDATDKRGMAPLHEAVSINLKKHGICQESVIELLKAGASTKIKNIYGEVPLDIAEPEAKAFLLSESK